MSHDDLEVRFTAAMLNIYERALAELNYPATRFRQMVLGPGGGLAAAKQLLKSPNVSDGFTELWQSNRLDLSMEALVLQEPWSTLFTDDERRVARQRLTDAGYDPDSA